MDLATSKVEQLTRTAYLSGLSPAEYRDVMVELCSTISEELDAVASSICDSILLLSSSFPRDVILTDYIRTAILEPRIPVRLWHAVSSFLKHGRSGIHDPSTLDMICRLIIEIHYATHLPPLGSLVPFTESPTDLLGIVTDSLYLLRSSYDFPTSPFHSLTISASDVLVLLLACIGDLSSVPTPQVTMALSHVHEVLQIVALEENIRTALDSFLLTLSMLLGDSTRQVEDAEMYTNFQMTPGRHDGAGPNPSLDLLSGSLIMNRLVSSRATQSGSGYESVAVANLVAWYRVSSQSLAVFYAHVFLSAMSCYIPESEPSLGFLWRSFILERIPVLLRKFQERLTLEGGPESEQINVTDVSSMQAAIIQVFTRHDLLEQCDAKFKGSNAGSTSDSTIEDETKGTFRYELLGAMITSGLLDHASAQEIMPTIPADFHSKIAIDLQESGNDVDIFIETRLSPDVTLEDSMTFFDRYIADYGSHAAISAALCDSFIRFCTTANIEKLGRICKVLTEREQALDVISLHAPLHDMIAHALSCLQDYDLTTVGDPQTAVSHIGEVVLFLQSTAARFRITFNTFHTDDRVLSSDLLRPNSAVYDLPALSTEDKAMLDAWHKAIFDLSSEGIDDDILRSTKPNTILRLSATLFSCAVSSCIIHEIGEDALRNGVSYYMGPLLNWTLVGVVEALLDELDRTRCRSTKHMAVLQAILTGKNCPNVVIRITKQHLLRVYTNARVQDPNMQQIVGNLVMQVLKTLPPQPSKEQSPIVFQPRNLIRYALATATTNGIPTLDLDRCLAIVNIRTFFDYFWKELLATASVGKIEVCRRFATYLLSPTSPLGSSSGSRMPPLLPIFMHAYVPSLLLSIDSQTSAEQTLSIQLLCTVIVSALTFSAHFERALTKSPEGLGRMPTLPSVGMAKRLRLDLRRIQSPSALALFQKLSASSTFVATFPSL